MNNNNNTDVNSYENDESFDIKNELYKYLFFWRWFVLSIIISLFISLFYLVISSKTHLFKSLN